MQDAAESLGMGLDGLVGGVSIGPHAVSRTVLGSGRLDELVLRVRDGDIEAFDDLMQETQGRVMGIAWRILRDPELAKDASQEAYLRAYKSLHTYRVGESFTAWIGRIVANVCCDYLKGCEGREVDPQVLELMPSTGGNLAESAVLHRQHAELVQRALAILTPAERTALVMRDMEGLSTNETAHALGLKPGTVRTQISVARSKVKGFCRRILKGSDTSKLMKEGSDEYSPRKR